MKPSVRELEICASSNFQLRTTLGAQKNGKTRKPKKFKKMVDKNAKFVNPDADLGIYCIRNLLGRGIKFRLRKFRKRSLSTYSRLHTVN